MRVRSITILLLLAFAAFLLWSCGEESVDVSVRDVEPAELAPISLPGDVAPHDDRIEWWYYSGHLEAVAGGESRRLGYHYALFRYVDDLGNVSYASHASITDSQAATPRHYQSFSLSQPSSAETSSCVDGNAPLVQLEAGDWCFGISESGKHRIVLGEDFGADGEFELNLDVDQSGPAVLHNETGIIQYLGYSYYYSYPTMETTGTVSLNGVEYNVTGTSWHDHQWGDFYVVGNPAGWQWFALTLDDGSAIKITVARGTSGETTLRYGTLHKADNTTVHIDGADIRLEELDTWISESSGAEYPSRWRLAVPSLNLELALSPVLADQENDLLPAGAAIYWEGQLEVEGLLDGSPVAGYGYAELTGYAEPDPIEWRN